MSQHYDFVHRLLVDFVFDRPRQRVEELLLSRTVDDFLEDLWDEAGDADPFESAPESEDAFIRGDLVRSDAGLPRARSQMLDDATETLLVTMPPPTRTTECHFCLIVFGERVRLLTLERSDGEGAMLCEWVAGEARSHVNYGHRPVLDADDFLSSAVAVLES